MRTNSYLHHASSVYDILLFYADKHISMSFKINLRLKLLGFYVHRASERSVAGQKWRERIQSSCFVRGMYLVTDI